MASSPNDDECTCDDNYTCPSCVAYKGKGDKGRGATRMAFIARARNRGVRFNVQFNERGQPIGDHSEKMMSYWGSIVKKFIPITFENWHKVPKTLKDTLFEDLTITFDVSMFRKKWFLTRAGEIWKNFKCELTRYWLFDEKKQLRDVPPSKYDFINTTHWRRFVKSRLTKEFQERSNANRHRGKDNKYPQKKGRRGCARFEQDLIAKKKANGEIVSKISRAELWKQMRSDEDENVSESTKEITDRIVWEFDDVGREDVLQRAFKKKEPGGRVWAVGKGVSQSAYFGSLPSKKEYKHELIEVNARLKRMEHEIMVLKNSRSDNEVSEKGNLDESCYDDVALNETPYIPDNAALNGKKSPHIPEDVALTGKKAPHIPQGVIACQLALSEPNYRVVAIGKVHNTGEVAHTLSLPEGFMRVGIDYAIEKQTPLPVPNEDAEAFIIKEAVGALVLWPTQLVVIDMPVLTLITIENLSFYPVADAVSISYFSSILLLLFTISFYPVADYAVGNGMVLLEKFYDLSGATGRRGSCCNVLRATELGSGGGCYQLLNREDGKIFSVRLLARRNIKAELEDDTPLDANDIENPDSHSHTPSKRKDEELSLPQKKRAKTNDSSHASSKLQPRTLDASHEIMVPHPETLPPDLQMLHKYASRMTSQEQINVHIDIGIDGQTTHIYIGREEIFQLLAQEQIGVCHIMTYMSLWYRRCQTLGLVNMFGFLCPSGISPVAKFKKGDVNKAMEHRMDRSRYIASVFNRSATKGRIFLAPYNIGRHWILCVIDPYNSIVYFMDPLHNDKNKGTGNGVCEDLRTLIET
ncbi:Ribosome-recycling factor [Bienertia sinuspersici]